MDIVTVIVALVFWWFVLKYSFLALKAVWGEISPTVIFIVEVLEKILYLPFMPFVALYHVIFGYPETEWEQQQREYKEKESRDEGYREQKRQDELEAIQKALELD